MKKNQTEFEKYIIRESEEEYKRKKQWRRLYPSD